MRPQPNYPSGHRMLHIILHPSHSKPYRLPTRHPPVYTPPPSASQSPDLSGSESEESDADSRQNHEPDIDEQSDDEDDRAAHELLCATPTVVRGLTANPTVLPYDHQGFAVSWFTCCRLVLNYITPSLV